LTTDPYTTGDLFVSYSIPMANGQMRYRLGVSNVTNDDAVMIISHAGSIQREEGRRVKFSASYSW